MGLVFPCVHPRARVGRVTGNKHIILFGLIIKTPIFRLVPVPKTPFFDSCPWLRPSFLDCARA